ncbi:MAG: hypothetical protein GTN78_20280, partial [Gemmatimonadales bacterium]|nr:hypothetical protein [Gemmatimonadales bacterium]
LQSEGERKVPKAVIRVAYRLEQSHSFYKPVTVTVVFPICASDTPSADDIARYGVPRPVAYGKLDGVPLEVTFLSYADLARSVMAKWHARIDALLEGRPLLREQVISIRKEAAGSPDKWAEGVTALRLWMWRNLHHGWSDEHQAYLVARGLLAASLPGTAEQLREAPRVQKALGWLDPTCDSKSLYEQLSEEWNHETLLLDSRTGQLIDTRDMSWEHHFGAFRFEITLQPKAEHELVVQHRQRLGYAGMSFGGSGSSPGLVGLRYILTHASKWSSWWTPTVEVRAPETWEGVMVRPPATEVTRRDGLQIHRIQFRSRPVEEFYVSVADWQR